MLQWRGLIELRRLPIAVLTPRGTVRTRKRPGRWSGNYPPRSPAEWLAERHVTCSILCRACSHMVDVKLDTLPQDQPWSRIGPNLLCTDCGVPGAVNVVPNWHDRVGHALPFSKGWRAIARSRLRRLRDGRVDFPPQVWPCADRLALGFVQH